ncbi:hypothetical protein GCM10023149_00400 [Mucilaginibacter gynuensis]|uniref:GAF domain-containing protein n=1 Tax=Mucilaginibacter gynuensis TaxID=1302236 RepID=A0ABP8FM18_9SPHI
MHTEILEINENVCVTCQVDTRLSFNALINHLEDRVKTEHPIKAQFYKFLLDKLNQLSTSDIDITIANVEKYQEVLVLIYTILTPLVASEKDFFWAMSTPVPDKIFFSTDAFYNFYTDHKFHQRDENESTADTIEKKQIQFIYQLILKKFYNFTSAFKNEKLYTYTDPETGLNRYYSIQADTQFIDVKVNGELPELDFEEIATVMQAGKEIEVLAQLLPLNKFKLEGFTIITMEDITQNHAIHKIRSALVNHTYEREAYTPIIESLRTLAGNSKVHFGLMPFLTVNDKLVVDSNACDDSILVIASRKAGIDDQVFYDLVEEYRKDPKPIFYNKITEERTHDSQFLKIISAAGIYSYTLIPIFHNNKLAGVMELYSDHELVIDEVLLSKLKTAIPLLAQLFKYSIDAFNAQIDAVLKDKFTSLQPSVQWKFNEVALNYIRELNDTQQIPEIETVMFENTYPLFGAVDIRNSTIERNIALQQDLKALLLVLIETLKSIKEHVVLSLIDKLIYNTEEWLIRIGDYTSTNDEIMLSGFLQGEVEPFLKHVKESKSVATPAVDAYFDAVKEESGIGFQKRRELEASMQLINTSVSHYLDTAQSTLQESYPCYFSKFRTDGVEYDIYIGQSIAPERRFSNMYLKNLRLWQIRSMADIARITEGLSHKMEKPLYTTQLIFIHSNPINISFRNDERRFDVEGAYNIRYEIVKKRIDKVLIKGTTERLTQPDKIALVYFHQQEEFEYLEYIQYLQEQGSLTSEVEKLDLEELQGVSGLKALRVGVNYKK